MRLWSLHPSLLDSKGLVACWREALLAKKVLEGNTKGYKNHSQLTRFKKYCDPLIAINVYLYEIWFESSKRGYNFDRTKIDYNFMFGKFHTMQCYKGQLEYEWEWFLQKVIVRDPKWYDAIKNFNPISHTLFDVVDGPVESWEVL